MQKNQQATSARTLKRKCKINLKKIEAPKGALLCMERKLKLKSPDTRTIHLEDDYAMEFWARELNVSQAKLRAAILVVGDSAVDVRKELNKPKQTEKS